MRAGAGRHAPTQAEPPPPPLHLRPRPLPPSRPRPAQGDGDWPDARALAIVSESVTSRVMSSTAPIQGARVSTAPGPCLTCAWRTSQDGWHRYRPCQELGLPQRDLQECTSCQRGDLLVVCTGARRTSAWQCIQSGRRVPIHACSAHSLTDSAEPRASAVSSSDYFNSPRQTCGLSQPWRAVHQKSTSTRNIRSSAFVFRFLPSPSSGKSRRSCRRWTRSWRRRSRGVRRWRPCSSRCSTT